MDNSPELIRLLWRDHVELFRKILSQGGLEKTSSLNRRVYKKQKKFFLSIGMQSAGKVAYGR